MKQIIAWECVDNNIRYEIIPENEVGDVDLNGVINISDATDIQRFLLGISKFTAYQEYLADVNGDGVISISDATKIQRIIAGYTE